MIEEADMKKAHDTDLFAEERKALILRLVQDKRKVTVAELVKRFGVTGATVRTDLRELEQASLLTRTHGGAIERTKTGFEPRFADRQVQNLAAKQRIARKALELIDDGDTILLDTGTTTLELARLLEARRRLTVVTNDLLIALCLEEAGSVQTMFMGGMIRPGFHCSVGVRGHDVLAGLTVDKAFLGTNGLTPEKGATTPDIQQAETKKAMIAVARKVILLCDQTKLGRVSLAQFASIEQVDTLVVDRINEYRKPFAKAGLQVVTAM